MPVKHIVLMKFKSESSDAVGEAHKNLLALKGKVPGILDLSFGPTFKHDRSQGFTHALVVDLVDESALEFLNCMIPQVYATHPEHVAVVTNNLKPNFEAPPLAMDYNF